MAVDQGWLGAVAAEHRSDGNGFYIVVIAYNNVFYYDLVIRDVSEFQYPTLAKIKILRS